MTKTATLILTTLPSGSVDVTYHAHTPKGNMKRIGQRITIAPWNQVLAIINPDDHVRVIVRADLSVFVAAQMGTR